MPDGFSEMVTGCKSLDDVAGFVEASRERAGFLNEAKLLMENRKAVLSRG
jgi:hypothetical protein